MSQFFEDLWESIFTPGPTPTLLVATNATFAVLQVVLLTLLLATFSIHFVILSFISGGLWWAINWFARELKAAQLREDAAQRPKPTRPGVTGAAVGVGADEDEDADEENEQKDGRKRHKNARRIATPQTSDSDTEVEAEAAAVAVATGAAGTTSQGVEPGEHMGELKQRKGPSVAAAQDISAAAVAAAAPAEAPAATPAQEEPASPLPVSTPASLEASLVSDSPPKGHHFSGSRSGVSTEDEWEKVSESEDR